MTVTNNNPASWYGVIRALLMAEGEPQAFVAGRRGVSCDAEMGRAYDDEHV